MTPPHPDALWSDLKSRRQHLRIVVPPHPNSWFSHNLAKLCSKFNIQPWIAERLLSRPAQHSHVPCRTWGESEQYLTPQPLNDLNHSPSFLSSILPPTHAAMLVVSLWMIALKWCVLSTPDGVWVGRMTLRSSLCMSDCASDQCPPRSDSRSIVKTATP